MQDTNIRQGFIINNKVRGDVVHLDAKDAMPAHYPVAIAHLLGEMLAAAALLLGTFKVKGHVSIQLQGARGISHAVAECTSAGRMRLSAAFDADFESASALDDAGGVLFVNVAPEGKTSYQSIIERTSPTLGACITHYQSQSMQIPSYVQLATSYENGRIIAGGILVQKMPEEGGLMHEEDPDLWRRIKMLTQTLKPQELTHLDMHVLLYRLYHEETVHLGAPLALWAGCSCSKNKVQDALLSMGRRSVMEGDMPLVMDCGFCGAQYTFDKEQLDALFEVH